MNTKTYDCICPVCRKEHAVAAIHMSGNYMENESHKPLIIHSCGKHTAEELKKAYRERTSGK